MLKEVSNVVTFEIILPVVIIGGLAWWMKSKKVTFDSLLEANLIVFFKLMQSLSTLGEIIVLSSIATTGGRMTLSDAIFRFGVLGILEIICTFAFITSYNSELNEAAKDGHINILETIRIIVVCVPIFFIGLVFTSFIHIAYLESCNYIEMQNFLYNDWRAFFPGLGLHFESNPEYFTDAMFDENGNLLPVKRLEWTANVSIYMTPMLNLFLVFLVYRNVKKAFLKSHGKKSLKERFNLMIDYFTGRQRTAGFVHLRGLGSYQNIIQNNFGINSSNFEMWVYEYIGKNLSTGVSLKTGNTLQDVIDGKKKPMDALQDLQKRLVGNGGTTAGLSSLEDTIKKLADNNSSMKSIIKSIDDDQTKYNSEKAKSSPDSRVLSTLTVNINGNKGKLKSLINESDNSIKKYETLREEFFKVIQSLGFSSATNSFSDPLIIESKNQINNAKTKT